LKILTPSTDSLNQVLKDSFAIYYGLIHVEIRKQVTINGKITRKENVVLNLGWSQRRKWLEIIT
jgi:hypothetical protein